MCIIYVIAVIYLYICISVYIYICRVICPGAMVVALGSAVTGVFTNSNLLWQTMQQVSLSGCSVQVYLRVFRYVQMSSSGVFRCVQLSSGVLGCVVVFFSVFKCVQVSSGVIMCGQVCSCVCSGMFRCVQVCSGVFR